MTMEQKVDLMDTFAFAEWLGHNYLLLHRGWIHKSAYKGEIDNYRTTEELWKYWNEKIK